MNTSIRAKGTALTSMACWIANFMIGQVSPLAFERIGWKYFLVFVICGFTNAATIWALFPETKGRTLEVSASPGCPGYSGCGPKARLKHGGRELTAGNGPLL